MDALWSSPQCLPAAAKMSSSNHAWSSALMSRSPKMRWFSCVNSRTKSRAVFTLRAVTISTPWKTLEMSRRLNW